MLYTSIFSNPIYINIVILCILVFLVLFLWRKITVLEGNFFILEKRVILIKKESRENTVNKKLENSNIIMNEIFQDIVSPDAKENIGTCSYNSCNIPSVEIINNDNNKPVNIENVLPDVVFDNIIEDSETQITFDMDKKDIFETKDVDTLSTTSEIVFNNDKYTNKKLSKLNLDKLKDICISENLQVDGTKIQIINRILELNKNITIE